jgi:hypothetical protein
MREQFERQLQERIERYGWPNLLDRKMSPQAEDELDALLRLKQRINARPEDVQVVEVEGEAMVTIGAATGRSDSGLWSIREILEDPGEAWEWNPQSYGERSALERTCIWCGKVLPTLEDLEVHEADCE